jgi:hypothetical protein
MRQSQGFKSTRKYKAIRSFICILFGQPDYTDHISNGVSFKWYLHKVIKYIPISHRGKIVEFALHLLSNKNIKAECKILRYSNEINDANLLSLYHTNPRDSFRILVRNQ